MAIVVGLDPGVSVSSDTGFVAFDTETLKLLYVVEIGSDRRELRHRLKDISEVVAGLLTELAQQGKPVHAYIEQFVMRGKGGETLQRLIGAIMAVCPDEVKLEHVQNTTVKLVMAGHGHADKASVAFATKDYFVKNADTSEYIRKLLLSKKFDILDALAIGVTGWKLKQGEAKTTAKRGR